jgi:hypothetical protein
MPAVLETMSEHYICLSSAAVLDPVWAATQKCGGVVYEKCDLVECSGVLRIAAATYATLLLAASPTISMAAVPVIPGASGFGITTPAGRSGTVYRVTNLNASGTGSLAACIGASGPRVCIFEVSGTIRVTDNLEIRNPNITIAGQTAPARHHDPAVASPFRPRRLDPASADPSGR